MAERNKRFLDDAYGLETPDETKSLYRRWAASYEEEIRANGYATPSRCAAALAELVADRDAPLLDLGCGTGLSGEAFRAAGFGTLDGSDFSEEMLAVAREKPGVYRRLIIGDLNNPLPFDAGEFTHVAAVGVFSPGHAPAGMIAEVVSRLPVSGCFVFSLNDHALDDQRYDACIRELVSSGLVELIFREYGAHLPGRGLKAEVLVLRRQ